MNGLSFPCNLVFGRYTYKKNKSTFRSSREDWIQTRVLAMEFAIVGHVLFSRNPEGMMLGYYNS